MGETEVVLEGTIVGKQKEKGRKGASPVQTGTGVDACPVMLAPDQRSLSWLLTKLHV